MIYIIIKDLLSHKILFDAYKLNIIIILFNLLFNKKIIFIKSIISKLLFLKSIIIINFIKIILRFLILYFDYKNYRHQTK
jgi:hypothetical protein